MPEAELKKTVDAVVEKWKGKEGNLIMALHTLQNHYGYIPREVSLQLSKTFGVTLAQIYEVLTFYNYFKLTKPGRHKVAVCMGTACYLKGGNEILDELKQILNIKEGGTTPDGMFQLEVVRCLGCCGLAPVIMVGEKIYGKVKKSELTEILSKYGREEEKTS